MGARKRSANVRLTLEPLEPRNLLSVDLAPAFSSRSFLASFARAGDPPAIHGLSSLSGSQSGVSVNTPPTGAAKTVSVTEDSPYTFTTADFGFSDPLVFDPPPPGGETAANVLVLYNAASASGIQIANHYAQVHAGVHLLGITGVDPNNETISADDYLSVIRPQVLAALSPTIDILVTTKGLPLRIDVTESALPLLSTYVDASGTTRTVYNWKPFASLESELTRVDTISTWQMMGDQSYILPDSLATNPYFASNVAFSYATFGTRLTSRLDGYTVGDVDAAIDRAQQAMIGPHNSPSGPFYFLVDNDPTISYAPTMANLVNNVLIPDGLPVVYDNTTSFVGTAPGPVIGYDSHGVHQASTPANYILSGLNLTLANGAVFQSWESYNAYSFDPSSNQHTNQGQIAQWLEKGGTAGVGNVEEPGASVSTVTNEDQMFRMLLAGRTFAEAAWSATYQLSYVNTVVGDPLMTWRTMSPGGGNSLLAVKTTTLPSAGTLTDKGVAVSAGQFVSVTDITAGQLKFTPATNANGSNYASFTFQVQDDGGTAGGGSDLDPSPKTMTVNVTSVNDAPSGANKVVTALEDTSYTFTSGDFGFSDPNDAPPNKLFAVTIATLPVTGTLADNGVAVASGQVISVTDITGGKLTFTPLAGTKGLSYASFGFQVQDDGGTASGGVDLDPSPKTITINVTPLDSTPPTVTAIAPASGSSNVAITAAAIVTFSEALDPATVSTSTIWLRNASNVVVPTIVSYNTTTQTVTLTPTGPLANSTTYTVVVKGGTGGVQDLAGNALVSDATSSFSTVAADISVSLWNNATTPALVDSGDGQAIEVGVKFTSDTNGSLTGLRFYKSAANTGAHTASLWTASGQLLATATFTGETASGWQQVNFTTPVTITAGTTYVASYHTSAGHYSVSRSYFGSQFNSGSLHVPANGGVYRYGTGGFPANAYQASNYWIDVVLRTTTPADTTPPTVTAITPVSGSSNVAITAAANVTFSEALDPATVATNTIYLRNASNVLVPTTVSYNPATKNVTLTPTGPLANLTTYTVVVKGGTGGVKDLAGNALVSDVTSSFTTVAAVGTPVGLWNNTTTPAIVDSGDGQAIEVGVKFTSNTNGSITGLRFYKSAANTGTHTASLWTASGQLLATATFTGETASGWQQVNFTTPVTITAGTTYVASYHTSAGHYSVSRSYFGSQFNSGSLHVPANGGVYRYGTGGFPANAYQASNYWVDVLFAG